MSNEFDGNQHYIIRITDAAEGSVQEVDYAFDTADRPAREIFDGYIAKNDFTPGTLVCLYRADDPKECLASKRY